MIKNVDRKTATIRSIYHGEYGYDMEYNPMKADLKGRIALVTGGTGMIGGAAATRLAESGAIVIFWGTKVEAGQKKEEELKKIVPECRFDRIDMTDLSQVKAGVDRILNDFGRIDILFANAGANFGNRKPLAEYDEKLYDKNIDLNLTSGTFYLSQLVLPTMIRQNKGSIIFTSSVCGQTGLMRQSGFVASKFAVSALTKSMALEYAKYNIRVNALLPGSVPQPESGLNILWDTVTFEDYDKNFENPDSMVFDIAAKRPGAPLDQAGLVVYLASDDANYTTGQTISVDGGWTCGLSGKY